MGIRSSNKVVHSVSAYRETLKALKSRLRALMVAGVLTLHFTTFYGEGSRAADHLPRCLHRSASLVIGYRVGDQCCTRCTCPGKRKKWLRGGRSYNGDAVAQRFLNSGHIEPKKELAR